MGVKCRRFALKIRNLEPKCCGKQKKAFNALLFEKKLVNCGRFMDA